MGRELQRNLTGIKALTSGQYALDRGTSQVVVCCPNPHCAEMSILSQRVSKNGHVLERWHCPFCSEQTFLVLCDYAEPVAE